MLEGCFVPCRTQFLHEGPTLKYTESVLTSFSNRFTTVAKMNGKNEREGEVAIQGFPRIVL